MINNKSTYNLFLKSGCLSSEALKLYGQGSLSAQDLLLVESHAENCSLCAEALKGIKKLSDPSKLEASLSRLESKIHSRVINTQKTEPVKSLNNSRRLIYYGSIAAGILLIAGIFSILFYYTSINKKLSADNYSIAVQPVPATKSDSSLSVEESLKKDEKNITPGKIERRSNLAYVKPKLKEAQNNSFAEHQKSVDKTIPVSDSIVSVIADNDISENTVNSKPVSAAGLASGEKTSSQLTEVTVSNSIKVQDLASTSKLSGREQEKDLNEDVSTAKNKKMAEMKRSVTSYADEKGPGISKEMPSFRGKGIEEFEKYISENIKYPEEAYKNKIEGTVYVSFVVDSLGKVIRVSSRNDCNPILETEAKRVVSDSPVWKAGKSKGKPTNFPFTIPVEFKIR